MTVDIQTFMDCLTASGILSEADLEKVQGDLKARGLDTESAGKLLANELVRAGTLSDYQAAVLLQGRSDGLVFGEYVVLDMIGAGGMATVYKARHRKHGKIVAVKVLSMEGGASNETSFRFSREVQAASKVSHMNIVVAYDCHLEGDVNYLVMEYVDGPTLAQHMAQHLAKHGKPLPVDKAIDYTLQTARGLAHCHQKRIIHRDIKPENLLLSSDGTVKILDLGLARFDNAPKLGDVSDSAYRLTQVGIVLGTADFMAPEQSIDSRRADFKSDIYALGCTLYFLLTAKGPFARGTAMATMMAHQTDPIPSLSESRADIPKGLQEIFARMVAKDPRKRPESMDEVIEMIELCVGLRAPEPPRVKESKSPSAVMSALPKPPKPANRSRVLMGVAIGGSIGLISWLSGWSVAIGVVQAVARNITPLSALWGGLIAAVVGIIFGGIVGFILDEI